MCTVVTLGSKQMYFGRNMDIDYCFGEQVVIMPRNYVLTTKKADTLTTHYALIGMANVTANYPLYAEAVNEKGLCMAGLNFPDNAKYYDSDKTTKTAITPYELIPYVLGKCSNLQQAKELLQQLQIVDIYFLPTMPTAPLHWIIADNSGSIVLECTESGMNIYDNALGVLTNNPPFTFHSENICQYQHLSATNTQSGYAKANNLSHFGQGMGAIGLPGDFSPASRFVKTWFCKANSKCDSDTLSCVTQVFHIVDSVAMVQGTVITEQGNLDITRYSCCIDTQQLSYYYKTYTNNCLTRIDLTDERREGKELITFALRTEQNVVVE